MSTSFTATKLSLSNKPGDIKDSPPTSSSGDSKIQSVSSAFPRFNTGAPDLQAFLKENPNATDDAMPHKAVSPKGFLAFNFLVNAHVAQTAPALLNTTTDNTAAAPAPNSGGK